MNKIILTDADGCLFHWNAHFNLFMHEKGLPPIPNTEDNYSVLARFGVDATHKAELVARPKSFRKLKLVLSCPEEESFGHRREMLASGLQLDQRDRVDFVQLKL